MKRYTATATREDTQWWVVEVEGVGVTQGRTTAEAQRMAADLVATMESIPAAEVSVDVTFQPPGELAEVVRAARVETRHAAEVQHHAAEQSRAAVGRLLSAGFSKQDAARMLKVAPQRISQLTKSQAG